MLVGSSPVRRTGHHVIRVRETTPDGGLTFANIVREGTDGEVEIWDSPIPTTTAILRDIDPFVDAAQIEEELKTILALLKEANIRTEDPRSRNNKWCCFVTVSQPAAEKLLALKKTSRQCSLSTEGTADSSNLLQVSELRSLYQHL